MKIALRGLTKRFGDHVVVDGATVEVGEGELFTLLGPSGCGKTTLLRLVAGFYRPNAGEVRFGEQRVDGLPAHARNIGMVFQNYALWPHMTVRANITYGLRLRRLPTVEIAERLERGLRQVNLTGLEDRYPGQLSGGQQQRVALARALVLNPDILLLDEPLSNLDANLRAEMRFEIRRLHDAYANTSIYVTHDQVEAMTMADRIVVMNGGRIEQIGTPEEVYDRPHSRFVARFIGGSNVLDGTHADGKQVVIAGHALAVEQGEFAGPGRPMSICVKTHDMHLVVDPHVDGGNLLPGVVKSQAYLGSHRDYVVDVGQPVLIAAPASLNIPAGSNVKVRLPAERCRGIVR